MKWGFQESGEIFGMEGMEGFGIDLLCEDVLQNILSRLPALSLASAACVSRSWRRVTGAVLSRPKIASAISLNPSCEDAVNEVLDSVLSRPIRPHFAYAACLGHHMDLEWIHKLITKKLGSSAPVITSFADGIIGSDAISEEFKEVVENDYDGQGILLIVGFMPGMKVDVVPLLRLEEPCISLVDKFVMDVRDYSAAVSGCTSPTGIVMFWDRNAYINPVLQKMDCAMSMETVIVGGGHGRFVYRSGEDFGNISGCVKDSCNVVALVFARDKDKPQGVGETQFHVALSTGAVPLGPTHKVVYVTVDGKNTELTAIKEDLTEVLDGERILQDIYDLMQSERPSHDLFIGVTKRRKCSIGSEMLRWVTTLEFYCVIDGDEEDLLIDGVGIKTGDLYRFYWDSSDAALSSISRVSGEFRNLKQALSRKNSQHLISVAHGDVETEVFGGIMFPCYCRTTLLLGRTNADSSPFLDNFPGVPLAGTMCSHGQIGHANSSSTHCAEGQEESAPRRCLLHYSIPYLVMSYTPLPLER